MLSLSIWYIVTMKPNESMIFQNLEIWFAAGSQHLYGKEVLRQVAANAKNIARALDRDKTIPTTVVFKGVLTDKNGISQLFFNANGSPSCVGIILWMHTFSPAKMWINGLKGLQKPMLHLHTQYNRDIPWSSIDMNFMNLNQSAHGGREFGFISSRMNVQRKVVAGHWRDQEVRNNIGTWARAAVAWSEFQSLQIARLGDNMRDVAVTEGDKVEAQRQLGFSVNGFGMGDLQAHIQSVPSKQVTQIIAEYRDSYEMAPDLRRGATNYPSLRAAARIEAGLRSFLSAGGFKAFTDTFENLTGLHQLPGIAVQRLMADGYGFGAEGDWKTAALVRCMKVMSSGLAGGNSFMEDYTYHFQVGSQQVLGAHMLEICPTITTSRPYCMIAPLSIGGKGDPVRLVFSADAGPALNLALVDLGHRFRMIANAVDVVPPEEELPNLPVARACWRPHPNLTTAATAWILAGGSHHTCFSQNITRAHLEDFCDVAGIELLVIDHKTDLYFFKQQLKWNEMYFSTV